MPSFCHPQPHFHPPDASSHATSASSACYNLFSYLATLPHFDCASFATTLSPQLTHSAPAKSNATIPQALDDAMDKANPTADDVQPGISMAFGPVDDNMDVDQPATNGASANGKRKASMTNGKTYKDASDSESDDVPLVCYRNHSTTCMRLQVADFATAETT